MHERRTKQILHKVLENSSFLSKKWRRRKKSTTGVNIWSGNGEKCSFGFQSTVGDNSFFLLQIQEDIALECSTAIIELLTKDVSQETGWLDFEF